MLSGNQLVRPSLPRFIREIQELVAKKRFKFLVNNIKRRGQNIV